MPGCNEMTWVANPFTLDCAKALFGQGVLLFNRKIPYTTVAIIANRISNIHFVHDGRLDGHSPFPVTA